MSPACKHVYIQTRVKHRLQITLILWNFKLLTVIQTHFSRLTLSQNKPWILRVCSTSLFENSVGRAISPFPTVFSTRLENTLPMPSNLKLSKVRRFENGLMTLDGVLLPGTNDRIAESVV